MRGALVVWMCLAVVARAEGSTRFHLRAWGVAEGLPQTSVTDLCEDERGFLWVATFGGLARFDGSRFVRSDPPHGDLDGHRFVSVACDGARIWAGTDTGRLFHFDDFGRGAPEELTLAPGGLQDPLWDLEVTRDGLRIAAGRAGVWAVRGAAAQQLSTSVSRFVASTPRGETWATGELQLHCVEGPCGEATVPLREKAQSLRVAAGQLFVGSAAGLEELVDGRLVLRAPGVVMFVDDPVHARRWTLGAAGLQVSLGATTEHLSLAWGQAPLREPKVRRLLADGHGVLWVATDDQGLVAVRDRGVELLGEERGLTMRSVLLVVPRARGGALLGGYCQGLLELSASGDRFSPAPGFTANDCVFAAMEDERGTVWLDRGGALLRWDAAGLTTVWTLPAGENSRVIVPRGDSVWLATTAGLVELDVSKPTATMRRRWTKADGLLDDGVMMLTPVTDGWLVGTQRGAMRLDAQGRLTRLIPAEQDRAAAVRDFFVEPSGVVWVATYGEGLARVAPGAPPTVTWLTREGGFCSDELSRVVSVGDALWFNSNQGAFRVRRASLEAHARGEGVAGCEPFVSGEGNGGGQLAGGLSNLGLLLPTVNGVARIDPSVPTPSRALPTFIDAAKVDETPLALQGVTRVPPGRRDLTISLASPHVTAGTLSIEQTLETEGRKLSRVGGRTATWLNLDPGDYVFTARRRSVDGTFGPPVTLRFRLEPRVLETPWARWGLPLLALALVALGVRWWTRTARARAEALEAELEQRRQLEAAQRERDEVYRTVFAGSPVPLFLIGDDDVIEELNPAARDAFPGARPGSSGLELLPSGERASFREVLQRARAGERISGVEFGGREPTQRGDERAGVFPAAESLARAEVETDPDQSSIDASSSGDTRPHDREAARSEVVTDPSTDQSSVVGSRNAGASAASTTYRSGAAESAGSTSARDWAASEPSGAPEHISAAAAPLDATSRSAKELSSEAARSAPGQSAAARLDDTSRHTTELSSAEARSAGVSEHRSARSSPVDSSAASAEPAASSVETAERRFTPAASATSARNGASTHGFELSAQTSPERTPAEPARGDRPPTDAPTSRVLRIDAAPLVRGARRSVLVATTDLTALRAAEREKRALLARAANAQRLEGLGRLAAGIAHDFDNVLAALSLQIEDLRRAGGDAKLTAEMTDAVDMGRNLTRRFLIFGRGDAELTAIDLDDAVAHGQALLGRLFPRDVTFEVRLGAPGAMAWLPRSHLDQLLLNLVVNARDATSGGGRVLVQTRRTTETREEQLQVLPRPAGELVELIVEDSGVGMDEATLTRAFEPFFTTKSPSQGTGVGLTIVHGIALRAGAGLTVSSIRGGGTRFVVQLRAAPRAEPLREEFPKPAAPAQPANKPTVLICDDVAPLRSAVGRVFRRAGFVVLEASDGEEALTRLAAEPVSVLVTDLVMPRVDGVELIKRVRASGSQVPIILLSGFPGDALARLDPPHRHRLVALEKPFVPEVLVKTAKELLSS
ncbi:MAG: ATP-binding protein [Myxococcota bacterium]